MGNVKLQDLTMEELIDLLSKQTTAFINMARHEISEEKIKEYKKTVDAIQVEIKSRICKT